MIGSTGKNTGKTTLACKIIKNFCNQNKIFGIKATTFKTEREFHHIDNHISSKEGFHIFEENSIDSAKDTARMLAAGAVKVFWLQAKKENLKKGFNALMQKLNQDSIIVCESNSLRSIVKPGVFIMLGNKNNPDHKASAEALLHLADKFIVFDGENFDIDLKKIKLVNGKWSLADAGQQH